MIHSRGRGRILDWDLETIAAGFADPNWVPQKITCVAFGWLDEPDVKTTVCGPLGLMGKPEARAKMLRPLLKAISEASMITGHNLIKFDLPVLNAECLRLGLEPISGVLVQDTMRLRVKTKGFKKGQDNLARLLKLQNEKKPMDWQQWQDAYDEGGWEGIMERASTDVIQHKEMRAEMLNRNWLKAPVKF